MNQLDGHFLIADPRLTDSNFFRSVVLITRHTQQGATGLVVNQPSNIDLGEIWENLSDSPLGRNAPLYLGGPVEGPLSALHTVPELGEMKVLKNVFVSMNRRELDELLSGDHGRCRVFSGYSGWGPGQLEQELAVGGWMTVPATSQHLFADPEPLYRTVCEELGCDILFAGQPPDRLPADPSLN